MQLPFAFDKDKIISVISIGSQKKSLYTDRDFLVLTKTRDYARNLQSEHTPTFLGFPKSYTGIHLICIGVDEIDSNFRPTSFRLRLLSLLIIHPLFLESAQKGKLVFGQKLKFPVVHVSKWDYFRVCLLSYYVLLFYALFSDKTTNTIWRIKALKFAVENYNRLEKLQDKAESLSEEIIKFRYSPEIAPDKNWLWFVWRVTLIQIKCIFVN